MAFAELDTMADEIESKYGKVWQASKLLSILFDQATKCHLDSNDSDEPRPPVNFCNDISCF